MAADQLRTVAGDAIWADSLDTAKAHSRKLESLLARLNGGVTRVLPTRY